MLVHDNSIQSVTDTAVNCNRAVTVGAMALILVADSDAILSSALQQAFQRQGPQMVVASHALQAESLTGRYSTGRLNRDLEDNRFVTSHPEVATDKERR